MSRDVRWKMPEPPPHNPWDDYSQSRWRNRCAPIIAEVIERVGLDDLATLRKELHRAYPFGERARHPYKIWCDEVKKQLGVDDLRDFTHRSRKKPKLMGQTSFFPVTPGEKLGAQLVRAGEWLAERCLTARRLAEELEEVLFS